MFGEKEERIIRGLLELALNGMEKELAQVPNIGKDVSIRENFNEYKGSFDSIMGFLLETYHYFYTDMSNKYHDRYYELTGKYISIFYGKEA